MIRDQDNRILCIRRRDNHLWCLPTGKVEPNESEEEAVRRELQEELGIGVEIWGLRAVYLQDPALHFRYPNGDRFHFVVFLFEGSFLWGSVRPCPEEVEEWGFFPEMVSLPLFSIFIRSGFGRWVGRIKKLCYNFFVGA